MQLPDQEEGSVVGANENAAALQSYGSESPRSPHEKLPERPHEGEASRSRGVEPPSEPLAGGHGREEAAVQQHGSPSLCSREAYCLIRDAARAGLGVVAAEPYLCTNCTMTFGREKKMQGHKRWQHRLRSASSSEEEAPTPKKVRKKPKPKRATVKMEPCHDEPPLPFPMVQGATSRRGRSPIHAAGEDLADPARSPVMEFRRRGTQVGVGGREDLVSLRTHQAGHVFGAHNDGHVNQAIVPAAENPEVTVSESTVTAHNVIAIEDDDSDNDNAMNVTGGDAGNANPVIAVMGFGPTASSAPDVAPVLPMARAPAAATEVIVIDDDSSDDDNVVNGTNAAAVLPLPRAPAAPTAADTVKGKNALNEGGACYSNGGHGKAVAGYSSAGHSKAAAGYSSGGYGYGYGKAIAIGGQSKRGPRRPYSCADCGETFYTPQALGGHANGHRSKEKKSMVMPNLQSPSACRSGRHVCPVCDIVFSTGQALGWHRKRVHYGGLVIGSASNTSSSSTPRPPANALEPSEATAMNSNAAAVHGTANAMRCRSFFPDSAGSAILALPALNPVQRMAMTSNPAVPGLVSAATAATGSWSWSLPATTSSFLPAIPLQNHGENPPEEIAVAPGNRAGRTIRAFSSQDQEENPPQELAMAPGNGEHRSIRPFGSDTSPQFPSQNQEYPPEERAVATGNDEQRSICLLGIDVSPALPSQNQEENPPQEIVPGNRGLGTILLFGVNLAEGPKEPKK